MAREALIYHGFPPETTSGVTELTEYIESRTSDVDLILTSDRADTAEAVSDAEIIIEHRMPQEFFERASALQWVQSLSAGVDRYDLETLEDRNVMLTNISGVHAQPIAEHVLSLMLAFERDLKRIINQQSAVQWRRFPAGELANHTVGIVGAGEIGGRIAEITSAVGMSVIGTKRDTSTYNEAVDEIYPPEELHTVLGASDYVVLAVPLTGETEGLIGPTQFSSMKADAVLINIARGKIIDQDELITRLQEGYLGGAALDVTEPEPLPGDSPLWTMDNVILSPHMAGGSPEFARRCGEIFVHNYEQYRSENYDRMTNRVR